MQSMAFFGRLALIFLMPIFAVGASIIRLVMLRRVNERLPSAQRISYRGAVDKRHHEFYPTSRLVLAFKVSAIGTLVSVILAGLFF